MKVFNKEFHKDFGKNFDQSFDQKVVFITGASSGIGAALAREFAVQGADLVLVARRTDRLQKLAEEIRELGHRALVQACDVTRDGDLEAAVQACIQEYGRLDVVIANAGFGVAGKLERLKLEDYRRQFETNVFGVLRTIYASLNELKKSKGTLVLIGSVAGYVAMPSSSAYAMSKHAVHGLADAIRPELGASGVSVVLIAPGFVKSEITKVDNQGVYHPDAPDPGFSWISMPTEKAARKIVRATRKKKAEQVITLHGKVVVLLKRHLPAAISLLTRMGMKGRKKS